MERISYVNVVDVNIYDFVLCSIGTHIKICILKLDMKN
jgi:hypothetical protein